MGGLNPPHYVAVPGLIQNAENAIERRERQLVKEIPFWSKRETTMNTKPLFTPTADGAAYDIQPAGVLMLLADTVYGDSCESSPAGRARAKAMIDAMLKAARAGGFTQSDILETLLSRGDVSHRVKALAVEACAAAGNDAIGEIFNAMRSR